MQRLAPLVVVLLVVAGLPAPGGAGGALAGQTQAAVAVAGPASGGAAGMPAAARGESSGVAPTATNNSTARLVIPRGDLLATGVAEQGSNMAAVLSASGSDIRQEHRELTLEERYEKLDGSALVDFLDRSLIELEDEAMVLVRDHRALIRAYAHENISKGTLLRRMASIHRRAGHILQTASRIEQLADIASAEYLRYLADRVRTKVLPLRGPVKKRIATAMEGNRSMPPVTVRASDSAIVLAMIDGGTYYREAYVTDNRDYVGETTVPTVEDALARYNDYYPWALEWQGTPQGRLDLGGYYTPNTYGATVIHPHGRLVAYLDGRTGEVFSEHQYLHLSELPTDPVRSVVEDGVRVVVNRTRPGGPVRIEIYDAATGERVGGVVELNGRSLGTTGDDGAVWVVEPRSDYTLVVQSGAASVTINVSAPN